MKLEDTLGGGYKGLYGEVVTADSYRLRQLPFKPDVIFDIGANIGIFSRFARQLFPNALIIAVEPDPKNAALFRRFTKDEGLVFFEMALGYGRLYHGLTARNGSGETYLSAGLGYPEKLMDHAVLAGGVLEHSQVPTLTLSDLFQDYSMFGKKHLLKIDCEGAENGIWAHRSEMEALSKMDYIAGEIHFYAQTHAEQERVREKTNLALDQLRETHEVELDNVHLWATKKEYANPV